MSFAGRIRRLEALAPRPPSPRAQRLKQEWKRRMAEMSMEELVALAEGAPRPQDDSLSALTEDELYELMAGLENGTADAVSGRPGAAPDGALRESERPPRQVSRRHCRRDGERG